MPPTRFTDALMLANGIEPAEFEAWLFCPGMLFQSPDKWWGDLGRRDFPHEGIDFCLYRDRHGRTRHLDRHTRIPVMHGGMVSATFADYLGRAVVLRHGRRTTDSEPLITVYAHTTPLAHIRPGVWLEAGEIIGLVADTRFSKAGIHPHLHFSLGAPGADLDDERFVWNDMRDPNRVRLIDPLTIIDRSWAVIDDAAMDVIPS